MSSDFRKLRCNWTGVDGAYGLVEDCEFYHEGCYDCDFNEEEYWDWNA